MDFEPTHIITYKTARGNTRSVAVVREGDDYFTKTDRPHRPSFAMWGGYIRPTHGGAAPSGSDFTVHLKRGPAPSPSIKYHSRRGWIGTNKRTLYAVTDKHTGRMQVVAGDFFDRIGPEVNIRVATRQEADADGWPKGWTVAGRSRAKRRTYKTPKPRNLLRGPASQRSLLFG